MQDRNIAVIVKYTQRNMLRDNNTILPFLTLKFAFSIFKFVCGQKSFFHYIFK